MKSSLLRYMGIGILALAVMTQYAGAFSWVLYGNVTNASTCAAIAGAVVSSPYNGGASNITNAQGQYRLYLGQGSFNVTVSATGYQSGTYTTPGYFSGAWAHNFSLIPVGGSAKSPPCFSGSGTTVVTNTIQTTSVPATTVPATTNQSSVGPSSSTNNTGTYIVVAIIVIIIIVALIWYLSKSGKKQQTHHHQT